MNGRIQVFGGVGLVLCATSCVGSGKTADAKTIETAEQQFAPPSTSWRSPAPPARAHRAALPRPSISTRHGFDRFWVTVGT